MKTIRDIKKAMSEPASKEWFKKHGGSKEKALKQATHTHYDRKTGKYVRTYDPLPKDHVKNVTKNWAKGTLKEPINAEKLHYQHKTGRGYNE